MESTKDPLILSVAAHDFGEYVRHYPRGKQYVCCFVKFFALISNVANVPTAAE